MEHFKVDEDQGQILQGDDPLALFDIWFKLAQKHETNDAGAMCIATVDINNYPDARMVLLKEVKATGFCFYTNQFSQKGRQLANLPKATICFHWKSIRRQVRIKGDVHITDNMLADQYFSTRPRGSQISAWVSKQSQQINNEKDLEESFAIYTDKFKDKKIARPDYWKGYVLEAKEIEFWVNKPNRLHSRKRFKLQGKSWVSQRLYP